MQTTAEEYDVVVIGSGPGGEGAAMKAAKGGKRVAVVERAPEVGGNCTHLGTIPSKALRQAIKVYGQHRRYQLDGRKTLGTPGYPEMIAGAASVIRRQVDLRQSFYDRNRVPVYQGEARFVDTHTVEVCAGEAPLARLRAKAFVIATGSRPWRPPMLDFTHPRILDADTVLQMDWTPQSMTVYGAGVIGCEYASMFRNLGWKMNLINTRDKLLSYLDDEIIDALSYHFRDSGITLRHDEELEGVDASDDGVVVHLKSGKKVKADAILFALGRTGNTDGLRLEAVGLAPNERGQLDVDEHFRTKVPHVYAVGDVIGPPALASAAYDQGRYVGGHLCGVVEASRLTELIPTGIYTSPEISSIGATERELTEHKVPYEVGHAQFKHLAYAQIAGVTVGMLKMLFHRESKEILGIHCFGDRASEIVHIGQAIMSQPYPHNTIDYFADTTFNYPTMAEAYRVAALNGLNRLF
ncbi:MAG: Si-specific NAD(P)(+) transhydrogenase [Alphaproteobacteria bacterium]|nr:Si-specific NAD(P)(+) transhydrogenase [Alphaproteobacteria bacterium]